LFFGLLIFSAPAVLYTLAPFSAFCFVFERWRHDTTFENTLRASLARLSLSLEGFWLVWLG
jgi:hypothetical protein